MCLVRADRVGEVLKLVDQFEEPVGAIIHAHHLRSGSAASAAEAAEDHVTPSGCSIPRNRMLQFGNGPNFSREPDKNCVPDRTKATDSGRWIGKGGAGPPWPARPSGEHFPQLLLNVVEPFP